jgi:hypothetical protein
MNKIFRRAMLILLVASSSAFAAKKDEPSVISAYTGKYKGTIILSGSGMAFVGSSQGNFTASSKKESGSLRLTSLVNANGMLTAISESFSIKNRSLTYILAANGSAVPGTGSVKVGKKRISYSAVLPVGSSTYQIFGTMTLSKRNLNITETIIISGTPNVLTYSLKRSGKSK